MKTPSSISSHRSLSSEWEVRLGDAETGTWATRTNPVYVEEVKILRRAARKSRTNLRGGGLLSTLKGVRDLRGNLDDLVLIGATRSDR